MHAWRFEAIGTVWEIETAHALTMDEREAVGEAIDEFPGPSRSSGATPS